MYLEKQRPFGYRTVTRLGMIAALLAGCASNRDLPRFSEILAGASGQDGRACIRQYDIRGYGVLKNDVISIDAGRRYYLATVMPGCTDLPTSMGIMFSSRFHEICGRSMDRIVTGSSWCSIDQIFEFSSRNEAFDIYDTAVDQRETLQQTPDQNEGT